MPNPLPAPVGGPLPRGHLLALNRSFRRTPGGREQEPRTVDAYTDAVRFLTRYCEAHGKPLHAHRQQPLGGGAAKGLAVLLAADAREHVKSRGGRG